MLNLDKFGKWSLISPKGISKRFRTSAPLKYKAYPSEIGTDKFMQNFI
jgi:hypothetical protein